MGIKMYYNIGSKNSKKFWRGSNIYMTQDVPRTPGFSDYLNECRTTFIVRH